MVKLLLGGVFCMSKNARQLLFVEMHFRQSEAKAKRSIVVEGGDITRCAEALCEDDTDFTLCDTEHLGLSVQRSTLWHMLRCVSRIMQTVT